MRIFEIASAEEQMALWKLISSSVWTAIEQQQQRERAAKGKGKRVATPQAVKLPLQPQRLPVQQQPKNAAAVNAAQSATDLM